MSDLLHTKSLTDPDIQECPWDYYRAMHTEAGGFYYDDRLQMYICADYQIMREILRSPERFSSVNSQNVAHMRQPPQEVLDIQERSIRPVNILVSSDPPDHARVRTLLDEPFRPRAIEKLRPQIQEIVQQTIDGFIDRGHFDAVADFAIPIPVTVIADLLGIDREHADKIKAWSDAAVEPLGMMITDERWIECARINKEFQEFITAELEVREDEPDHDLLTYLIEARDCNGHELSLGEMLAITGQLLVAGNETTTNALAAGVALLIENPQQQQILRNDPQRIFTFVNEVLRLESPVQGLFRINVQDTEINGIQVPAGARIMIRFAAANRDPKKYPEPDALNVERHNAGTQVGFGAGIHHCLGANLAREEMIQAFTALLDRCTDLQFTPGSNDFSHHPSLALRGLKNLYVDFVKA